MPEGFYLDRAMLAIEAWQNNPAIWKRLSKSCQNALIAEHELLFDTLIALPESDQFKP